jgi:glutamate mutase epsilon subunit
MEKLKAKEKKKTEKKKVTGYIIIHQGQYQHREIIRRDKKSANGKHGTPTDK